MKILFISDVYFPRINGVSTSIRTFVGQLQELGHEVHLIAPDYGVKTEDEHWIRRIPARTIYFDPEDRLMKYGAALDKLVELRAENYDLIHIHTPFVAHYLGLKLGRLLDVPCVETYHTFFEDYLHHYLPWIPKAMAKGLARMVSRQQCNAVQAIVAPSRPMLDVLRQYGINSTAEVIPTGLQPHSFADADGAAFRSKYGIAPGRPVALFVGRVAFEKNIAFLVRMLTHLRQQQPDALLVIAGEGPAESSLHAMSKQLGLQDNIQFIGYLDREKELNACYRAADVFVFSSKTETQGLVLLEAMAQGTPVVALAELGTKSILIEGEGALIAPEDEQVFAEKVRSLFSDEAKRKRLGESARQYAAKRWTSRTQAERMLQFYEQLISA
ncbi:glycosyltransferase [Methylovorus mays]|uniref:glycosyltransferase n=1 Tax=Methylovorus mays TaxID=184077 RepID=UPI001E58EBB6|nr:glycosyltransferase [Methylovorus mays]MCB5206915.1 glycosyltransferase [Methylovorus mays]